MTEFNLQEYTKSQTAFRLGIDNSLYPLTSESKKIIMNLRALHRRIVVPCVKVFGRSYRLSVNSGYRCLELNRALKSKDTSQHITGQAVDFEFWGLKNSILYNFIQDNLDYDQLIYEGYKKSKNKVNPGWIHCSYISPTKNRREAFELPFAIAR